MWQYNELYHHGIKGQKWGVRRFQNQDGTLTRRGRIRYKDYEKAREGTGDTSLDELKTLSKKSDQELSDRTFQIDLHDTTYWGDEGTKALHQEETAKLIRQMSDYKLSRYEKKYQNKANKEKAKWENYVKKYGELQVYVKT